MEMAAIAMIHVSHTLLSVLVLIHTRSLGLEPLAEVAGVAVSSGPSSNHDYRPRGAEPSDINSEADMTTFRKAWTNVGKFLPNVKAIPHRLPLRSLFNLKQ
jgi:hypothetical protein